MMRRSTRALGTLAVVLALGGSGCDPTDVITHDVKTPSIAIVGIAPGETISVNRAITISASDEDSNIDRFEIFFDGSQIHDVFPNAKSVGQGLTLIASRETAGQHGITVKATDAAQNMNTYSISYWVFAP